MSIEYRFIEPLDVLFLRGNKLFGGPGSYGECLVPPWPSVAAGAIRSRMLVDDGVDLSEFSRGHIEHPALGTPGNPGVFILAGFYLAKKETNGKVNLLQQAPSDLTFTSDNTGTLSVNGLYPQVVNLPSSYPLGHLPVLAQGRQRKKPESGYWLTRAGWSAYLQGQTPTADQLVHSSALWSTDSRVGIGMNAATRSVDQGKLFTAQALSLKTGVGFVAAVQGAQPPTQGLLRFGGDGRGAVIMNAGMDLPEPDYQAISQAGRCRLVLTTPGLFPEGWTLPGTGADSRITLPGGITAKLVSAAVQGAEILSGWDLAGKNGRGQPKTAQRVAPTGSVYWLDNVKATPEALRKLAENGLWNEPCEDPVRRAEGFNRCAIAAWSAAAPEHD